MYVYYYRTYEKAVSGGGERENYVWTRSCGGTIFPTNYRNQFARIAAPRRCKLGGRGLVQISDGGRTVLPCAGAGGCDRIAGEATWMISREQSSHHARADALAHACCAHGLRRFVCAPGVCPAPGAAWSRREAHAACAGHGPRLWVWTRCFRTCFVAAVGPCDGRSARARRRSTHTAPGRSDDPRLPC